MNYQNNLRKNWSSICDYEANIDLPHPEWNLNWNSSPINASMIYAAIKQFKPKVIVETGTFEAHGTYAICQAAHENNNQALIVTIDYDGDPTTQLPSEMWKELSRVRQNNLEIIKNKFHQCTLNFLEGDSREVLPSIFPKLADTWDFFYQDSMHFKEGIISEWSIMRKFAHVGSIAVFDDLQLSYNLPKVLSFLSSGFCGWFIRHEMIRGWDSIHTEKGHGQLWVQKVR